MQRFIKIQLTTGDRLIAIDRIAAVYSHPKDGKANAIEIVIGDNETHFVHGEQAIAIWDHLSHPDRCWVAKPEDQEQTEYQAYLLRGGSEPFADFLHCWDLHNRYNSRNELTDEEIEKVTELEVWLKY